MRAMNVLRVLGPGVALTGIANAALIGTVGHGEVPWVHETIDTSYHTTRVTQNSGWQVVGIGSVSKQIYNQQTDFPDYGTPSGKKWDETIDEIKRVTGEHPDKTYVEVEVDTPDSRDVDEAIGQAIVRQIDAGAPRAAVFGGHARDAEVDGVRVRVWAYDEKPLYACAADMTVEQDDITGKPEVIEFPIVPIIPVFLRPKRKGETEKDQPETTEDGPEPGRKWSPKAQEILDHQAAKMKEQTASGAPSGRTLRDGKPSRPARASAPRGRDVRGFDVDPRILGAGAVLVLGGIIAGTYYANPIHAFEHCKDALSWTMYSCPDPEKPSEESQDGANGTPNQGDNQQPGTGGNATPGGDGTPNPAEVCPGSYGTVTTTIITKKDGVVTGTSTQTTTDKIEG